jgi:hypothetical protein
VVDAFSQVNLRIEHSERDRSACFSDCVPLFTGGRARILDNKRLIGQFAQLERRLTPGGKERITHPSGNYKDDAANAAAMAMTLSASGKMLGAISFHPDVLDRIQRSQQIRKYSNGPPPLMRGLKVPV